MNQAVTVTAGGKLVQATQDYHAASAVLTVHVDAVSISDAVEVTLGKKNATAPNPVSDSAYTLLNRAQIPFATKEKVYRLIQSDESVTNKLSTIQAMPMDETMKSVLQELLLADC